MRAEWEILKLFFQALGKWTNLSDNFSAGWNEWKPVSPNCPCEWVWKKRLSELELLLLMGKSPNHETAHIHLLPRIWIHRWQSWISNKNLVSMEHVNAMLHPTKSSNIGLECTWFEKWVKYSTYPCLAGSLNKENFNTHKQPVLQCSISAKTFS